MDITIDELNQVYYINKEIKQLYEELANIKQQSFMKNITISDMPRGGESKDIFTEYTDDVMEIESIIQYSLIRLQRAKKKAEKFLTTASKRAYLQGEGGKRQEWGISTVIMNKRGNPCPKCLPWVGKILIDDVWSGGSRKDGKYPLMSTAIASGLYHPRCKDSHTTYFEGISTPPDDKFTQKELSEIEKESKQETKQQYAERQADKFERLAKYSLDPENKLQYQQKGNVWKHARLRTGDIDSKKYAESKRPLANFHAVPQDKVVNVLREESQEWIEQLTDQEKLAIRKYTYNSGDKKPDRFFERLNAMLRGERPTDKRLMEYANTISRALQKNRLNHDVVK